MLGLTHPSRPPMSARGVRAQHGFKFETSVIINQPPEELYSFWKQLDNLPHVFPHLTSVHCEGNKSHWVALGPMDRRVEWDAETINERENELIAWRSLPGSELDTAGSVHFQPAPGGRGTVVKVELKYDPPGGKAGATIADLLGVGLEDELVEGLRRFKQVAEAGERPTTKGQSRGQCR